jgi:predicted hydrocarbon binding protein
MNRILLEEMLKKMKTLLENNANIGDLKIGALYALGNQLEAIFYFIGHELGSKLEEKPEGSDISNTLEMISKKYNLGGFQIIESAPDHITFNLNECRSCKDIENTSVAIPQGFCSFEAGLYAGVVEKITGKHCFAQELECHLQGKSPACQFMIVIPQE